MEDGFKSETSSEAVSKLNPLDGWFQEYLLKENFQKWSLLGWFWDIVM